MTAVQQWICITDVYFSALGGIVGLLVLRNLATPFERTVKTLRIFVQRRLIYPVILPKTKWIGPWAVSTILLQISLLGVNLFMVFYQAPKADLKGRQAGTAAMVNLTPFYLTSHLAYGADVFGLSLSTFRMLHRLFSVTIMVTIAIHVAFSTASRSLLLWLSGDRLYGFVVVCTTSLKARFDTKSFTGLLFDQSPPYFLLTLPSQVLVRTFPSRTPTSISVDLVRYLEAHAQRDRLFSILCLGAHCILNDHNFPSNSGCPNSTPVLLPRCTAGTCSENKCRCLRRHIQSVSHFIRSRTIHQFMYSRT